MNCDQIKGAAKDLAGKIQQKIGELMRNESQQAKGVAKQVDGMTQKVTGNVEQWLNKARKTIL